MKRAIASLLLCALALSAAAPRAVAQTNDPLSPGVTWDRSGVAPIPPWWDPSVPYSPDDPRASSWDHQLFDGSRSDGSAPNDVYPALPDPASDPDVASFVRANIGWPDLPDRAVGPMGWSAFWVESLGGGRYRIRVEFVCWAGWTVQSVQGVMSVTVYNPMTQSWRYEQIIPLFDLNGGSVSYSFTSPVYTTRPGNVVTVTGAAGGIGYSTWVGVMVPTTWRTPVLRATKMVQ